jgi:transcriptional regulator with XRE-family HTH domain
MAMRAKKNRASGPSDYEFDRHLLKQLRVGAGYELTPFANLIGKSVMSVVRYESGETVPSAPIIARMASILKCRPGIFFKPVAGESASEPGQEEDSEVLVT